MNRTMTGRGQRHASVDDANPRRSPLAIGVAPSDGRSGAPAESEGQRWRRAADAGVELLSDRARPLRFALVGGICGGIQLGLLALFLRGGAEAIVANSVAFMLSAQLNFALSALFIWHDRSSRERPGRGLWRRWLAFHGSIAGTALLNQLVFVLARTITPELVAAGAGIGAAAAANFLVQDRLVFRRGHSPDAGARYLDRATPVVTTMRPAFAVVNGSAGGLTASDEPVVLRRRRPAGQEPVVGHETGDAGGDAMARVDIVIPVYNEGHVLAGSIGRLHAFLTQHLPHDWRIVIADNASTDDTLSLAHALRRSLDRVEVLHLDAKGRGRALKAAWLRSDADVLAYMDVDLSTDLAAFPPLVRAIVSDGFDVATGRRLGRGARVVGRRRLREVTSRAHNLLIKLGFRARFTDAQCGFKAISRRAAQALLPLAENNEWFFDTELLLLAERKGYRIKQIPVRWVDDPDSRVNVTKTAIEDLRGLWRMKRAGP